MNTMLQNSPDLEMLDKRYLFHPFTALADHERNGPMIIVKGDGVWLEDHHGRRYIDGMAGLWCVTRALPHADTISFSPPFVISEDEILTMVTLARQAVDEVMDELVRERIWAA